MNKAEYINYIAEWYDKDYIFQHQIQKAVSENQNRHTKMSVYVYHYSNGHYSVSCPRCNAFLANSGARIVPDFCPECGQELDWSAVEALWQTENSMLEKYSNI